MKTHKSSKDTLIEEKSILTEDLGMNSEVMAKDTFLKIPTEEETSRFESDTKEIKRRNKIFYLISAGNATGQTFLFNFFSAFAALIGVTTELLGFITSIRNLMTSLFQGTIGRLSDKYGRRYFLLIGFFMVFSSLVVLVFIKSTVMLVVVSIIQAFSLSIIIPVWNATLGDVTEMEERASYIGKLSALGTILSITLMLILATVFYLADEVFTGWIILGRQFILPELTQYSIAFGLAAFNFLLCVLGAFLLRETRVMKEKKEQPSIFVALKNKTFTKFFFINSIFGLIMATMWPIFPIAQVTLLDMSFAQIAIINAIFSSCSSLAQYFGGKIGDKIGRKPLLIFGRMGMFTIPLIMIGAVMMDNWLLLIISNVIGGAAMGATNVSMNAYILDIAPDDQMGAYSGLNQVGWGITTFIGSLSAGFIAKAIETSIGTELMVIYTFSVISVLRFLTSIGFFFITESFSKEARVKLREKRMSRMKKDYPLEYSAEDSQFTSK